LVVTKNINILSQLYPGVDLVSISSEFETQKAMDAINKLLNLVLPPLSLILLSIFMLPSLIFNHLIHLTKSLCKENVASKVVLITGAASGIGEVCLIRFFFLSMLDKD